MSSEPDLGAPASRVAAQAQLAEVLRQLGELEPRLAGASSVEVEMSLLQRATEHVEQAGRLLEYLGRVAS